MDSATLSTQKNIQAVRSLMEYGFIAVAFLICFFLMYTPSVEFFGIELFCGINFIFCILMGKQLVETFGNISSPYYSAFLAIGIIFSFVSTILIAMTTVRLHKKMTENNRRSMPIQPSRREELNNTKSAFIATTVLIWITAFYTYFKLDEINRFIGSALNLAENGMETQWFRALSPLTVFAVGSLLMLTLTSKTCTSDPTAEVFKQSAQGAYAFFILYGLSVIIPFFASRTDMFRSRTAAGTLLIIKCIFYFFMVLFAVKGMSDLNELSSSSTGECYSSTSASSLYTVFFVFLLLGVVLPSVPYQWLTRIVPSIMEHLPALALMGTSAYLVYMANRFTGIAAEEIIA